MSDKVLPVGIPFLLKSFAVVLAFGVLAISAVSADQEYFVSPFGSNENDGTSPAKAFESIQRGVDALAPGDTLTIKPGEYFEAVSREDLGDESSVTTIRAAIPGSVFIRGNMPAPEFKPVEGYRYVYGADFDQPVQAVNEADTLRFLGVAPSITELEFNPGTSYYDKKAGRLYISTSDLRPPSEHVYEVAVVEGRGGIFLHRPVNVVIDGIAATGFHSRTPLPRIPGGLTDSDIHPWGIFLSSARGCVVRNVTVYLNAGGLTIRSGGDAETGGRNRIENAVAYGNGPGHGMIIYQPNHDELVDSVSFLNGRQGISFYASSAGESRMARNLSWGNRAADMQVKAGGPHLVENCVGVGSWGQESRGDNIRHSLIGNIRDIPDHFVDNIVPEQLAALDWDKEFADPVNRDFRLQSTSVFREAETDGADLGPFPYEATIFYVKPGGDDDADGLSVETAWGSLKRAVRDLSPGDTLYLEAGDYDGSLVLDGANWEGEKPVVIRGRGVGLPVLKGAVEIRQADGVELERLAFVERVLIEKSHEVRLTNCQFEDQAFVLAVESDGLRVTHCEFYAEGPPSIRLESGDGLFSSGNFFAVKGTPALHVEEMTAVFYSDYNAYRDPDWTWVVGEKRLGIDALREKSDLHSTVISDDAEKNGGAVIRLTAGPAGTVAGLNLPAQRAAAGETFLIDGPRVHSVTDTTANLEWWISEPSSLLVAWGREGDGLEETELYSHRYGNFSLTGLQPDTHYSFQLRVDGEVELLKSNDEAESVEGGAVVSFATASSAPEPQTYYVAVDGDDTHDGLSSETALRTVNRAADLVRPGDTVLVGGGTYQESVRMRVTGEEDRPITFQPMPGEKVEFDGDDRTLTYAFVATDKSHLNIDGFYFRSFGRGGPVPWVVQGSWSGVITLYRADDILVTRCFSDGRGQGYGPGLIQAIWCENVTVRNCVISDSMGGGLSFYAAPGFRIENNVFLRNKIQNIAEGVNQPDQPFYVENNIFTDNLPGKVGGALFAIGTVESFQEDNNCYFFRIPAEERMAFQFYDPVAYGRPAETWGMRVEFEGPLVTELTRMTFFEFKETFNPSSNSIIADPDFAGAAAFDDPGDGSAYVVDQLIRNRELDFNDLFATNPEVVERGIGLQPEVFEDFHFKRAE